MGEDIWVGLDVHARSIAIAVLRDRAATATQSEIANDEKLVRRALERLRGEGSLRVAYEAGPCGYELHRLLTKMGIDCVVVAPSLIPRKPGERIKTDRRDAEKLARMLRAGELTEVTVPSAAQESARDLVRARDDVRKDRTAARQRLSKFLLRRGRVFSEGRGWTQKYWRWVDAHRFEGADLLVFEHYRAQVRHLDERIRTFDKAIAELAMTAPFKTIVDRLCCLPGICTLSAMVIVTELYDLRRFTTARQLMAFVGGVPSEHSSGEKTRRGGITKTGNAHVRRILVEAAWAYRRRPRQGPRVRAALEGQPERVAQISHRALHRLSARYGRLVARGKPPVVANVAVARELCGFLWAMAVLPPERAPVS